MGISLKPSDAVEGGAVPVDRNLLWKECRFDLFQYPARKDGTVVLGKDGLPVKAVAGRVIMVDDDGNEYTQHYSVGDPERFVIENDGKTLGPEGVLISKSCNFFALTSAAVNAGFPDNKLGDDFSVMDGLYAHHIGIPEPKRSGLVRAEPAEGARERILSVPDRILRLPWEGKKGEKGAKAATKATTKAGAGVGTEEASGDLLADAVAMVAALLKDSDTVTRQQVATKAIRDKKNVVAGQVFKPEFQAALLASGYSLDGENISKAE